MLRRRGVPSYRLHRPSGQAVVTLSGKDLYLGSHGSETSRAEYDRLIAEWLAAGRRPEPEPVAAPSLLVNELLLAYWEYADGYYRSGEEHSSEWHLVRTALRVVRRLYGHTAAAEFGPKALRTCREELTAKPHAGVCGEGPACHP